jgi:Xaa-Pro aminopeptidase
MVFTVEPGLYVPDTDEVPAAFRGIGIRIEDDVLITHAGVEVLSADAPTDPSDIEALRASAA